MAADGAVAGRAARTSPGEAAAQRPAQPPRAAPEQARVVTRVTSLGYGLLGTALVLATAGVALRYPELLALAAAALGALAVAGLAAARRPGPRASLRVTPTGVARGEAAELVVEIHNPSRRPSPPVRLEIPWALGARPAAPARRVPAHPASSGATGTEVASGNAKGAVGQAGSGPVAGGLRDPRTLARKDGADGPGQGGAGLDGAPAGRSEGRANGGTAVRAAPRAAGTIVMDVRGLAGLGTRTVRVALDTRRRGVVSFGPARVRRADPFGLVRSEAGLSASGTLRVRPRARPVGAPPAAPARDPDGRTSDGAAGGVLFHGLREYVAGEDLRFVHWPSSARTGVLMVREHVEPSEPASIVMLDSRPQAYPPGDVGPDTFEEAVDAAASIVLGCARESLGVVLLTTDGARRAGRGRSSETDALLDTLAEVALDPAGTLEMLGAVRRGGVGTLVVVTGGFDAGQMRAVAPVVHRFGQVVVVRVGARSAAAARARSRRQDPRRPRLRRAASPDAATLLGRFDLIGRPSEVGSTVAGRLRVLDVPDAARLAQAWPASGLGRAAGVRSNSRAGYFGGGV